MSGVEALLKIEEASIHRGLLLQLLDNAAILVDGIERDYANAKAVARAMAERDPEMRLH